MTHAIPSPAQCWPGHRQPADSSLLRNDQCPHAHKVDHELPQQDKTQLCVEDLSMTFW